jgi:hypothetical protein
VARSGQNYCPRRLESVRELVSPGAGGCTITRRDPRFRTAQPFSARTAGSMCAFIGVNPRCCGYDDQQFAFDLLQAEPVVARSELQRALLQSLPHPNLPDAATLGGVRAHPGYSTYAVLARGTSRAQQ